MEKMNINNAGEQRKALMSKVAVGESFSIQTCIEEDGSTKYDIMKGDVCYGSYFDKQEAERELAKCNSIKMGEQRKYLTKVKQFNSETITQEIAAKMCAILGLWKHYTEKPYLEKGFVVEDKYEWVKPLEGGGRSIQFSETDDPSYIKTHTGVSIKPKDRFTRQEFRISQDGDGSCTIVTKKGDWLSSDHDGTKYAEKDRRQPEYHCSQIRYVLLLIAEGFYSIEGGSNE